jgi:hypothetical protein
LPMFWVTALGWVGVRAGNIIKSFSDGTSKATQAGAKAVNKVI